MQNLKYLTLDNCQGVTTVELIQLAKKLHTLRSLILSNIFPEPKNLSEMDARLKLLKEMFSNNLKLTITIE
jgi:hypothetical protein